MAQIGTTAIRKLQGLLQDAAGLPYAISAIRSERREEEEEIRPEQIIALHAPVELMEKTGAAGYPVFLIYCERMRNELKEKFRTFSGSVDAVVEIRATHDRIDGIGGQTQTYVDAVLLTLNGKRGDWGDGVYFPGTYEVQFGSIRSGGKNFLQTAKISCELKASM